MDPVVGFHPVREALRARRRRLHRLRWRRGLRHPELDELVALAEAAGIPAEAASAEELTGAVPAGVRSQGIVLDAGPLPVLDLDELVAGRGPTRAAGEVAGSHARRRLVILDGVEDPQNVGAVVRVAEASGALGLVLAARRAPPLGPAVSRASAGAIEHLPVSRVPNLRRSLVRLKERGFWAVGSDAAGGEDLFATPDRLWTGDLALVFGAEGRGLRPGVAALLDHRVRIPLAGRVGSLNVAAAAAIVLFEAARRCRPSGDQVAGNSASTRN